MSYDLLIQNGDLVLNNGELAAVTDYTKLIQDILKICLTDVGSNPIHPSYGSFLSRSIVGNAAPPGVINEIATTQINSCLINLQQLQKLQIQSFQQVSADEQIAAVLGISVVRSAFDPRLYNVRIKVMTKGMKPIVIPFTVNTI